MSGKLSITLIRSLIGRPKDQRLVVEGLGLRKREQTVILPDNSSTRGAAFKIRHMLHVEEVKDDAVE
jgi:large subunit ribosomal protein L30